jgi:hypothetical protein
MNDIVKPKTARRAGLRLNRKLDTNIEKIGVVLTKTVAFSIVVSFTAETKKMKCKPRKKLRIARSLKFLLTSTKLKDFLRTISIMARAKEATIKRQKAIEKASKYGRILMKIEAVPNRTPADTPSINANFLVF